MAALWPRTGIPGAALRRMEATIRQWQRSGASSASHSDRAGKTGAEGPKGTIFVWTIDCFVTARGARPLPACRPLAGRAFRIRGRPFDRRGACSANSRSHPSPVNGRGNSFLRPRPLTGDGQGRGQWYSSIRRRNSLKHGSKRLPLIRLWSAQNDQSYRSCLCIRPSLLVVRLCRCQFIEYHRGALRIPNYWPL